MKPLKLTLINFGPYAEQVFNFERLQQVPLFLITGKTGSGKTTIFDGITFALFGETAGGDRSAASLRSDFAEPQAETLVVLEFEHQGQHYRITRNPKQLLAKKRGSGMREIAAAAKLESFDGEKKQAELTKVRDVNLKIEAILQLNRQQFVQIVLLPQGDFRRFLLSDSNEKEAILRKIFRTQLYQQWSETLREFLKSQQGKITQQQAAIKQAFKKIRWEDPAVVLDELNSTEQLKLLAQQQTRAQISLQDLAVAKKQAAVAVQNQQNELTAGKKLNQQFAELKQLQNKLQISHQQQPKYYKQAEQIKILEWAQKQQPLFVREQELQQRLQKVSLNLQTTKKHQQQQQQVLQEFQKQKELLLEQKEVQQQRETTKVLLTEQKSQFEKAAGLTKKVQHQDEQVKKIEIEQKLQQKKLSQLTEKLEKIAGLQTELPQLMQQRNFVDQTKLQLTHFKEQVVNLLQEQQALQALTTEVKQLQIKFEQAQLQSSNQQTAYQQLHDAWLNNQIAVLASQLSPGAPCPVCGSLNHPQPADQAMMKSINNTELKAAEKNKLAAEKNLNHLAAHLTEKKRTLTQQKEIFQQTKRELLKQLEQEKYLTKATLTLGKIQQVLTNQLQDQSQQLVNLEEQVDVNQNSVAQRPQLLHQQQIEQQKVQQLGLDFQNEHDEQQRLTVRLAEIKRGLPKNFADIAELNSYLTGLEQKITTYQQQVTENQQQLERLQQQCASSAA
ncbi:MAG: SMC family ATPase, partial [Liquorilactobacillus nagelii]|uniref:AAA family ATPase n=1 Tax=Liquorilactobacillus nagelii TaxID=82688 RepID=UPI0039EBAC52